MPSVVRWGTLPCANPSSIDFMCSFISSSFDTVARLAGSRVGLESSKAPSSYLNIVCWVPLFKIGVNIVLLASKEDIRVGVN